jgi:hypothetical protein
MLQVCTRVRLLLCLLLFPFSLFASVDSGEELDKFVVSVRHYEELSNSLRQDGEVETILAKGKPEDVHVILFFSYGCHGCSYFNSDWQKFVNSKHAGVLTMEVPVTWNRAWRQLGKAYYTVRSIAPKKDLSDLLFTSVQKHHKNIANPSTLAGVLSEEGFDKKEVVSTFESFHVEHEVSNAATILSIFGIQVTPSVVVIGPHKIYRTSLGEAGTAGKFLKVINFLIEKEKQGYS